MNIIGRGLEPLRSSLVLEQIDLSLIGHERACLNLVEEPLISVDAVVPILESILAYAVVANSIVPALESFVTHSPAALKHVILPMKWPSSSQALVQFVERYNQLLENRNAKCSRCNSVCRNEAIGAWVEHSDTSFDFGMQKYICWKCVKNFCCGEQCLLKTCSCCEN